MHFQPLPLLLLSLPLTVLSANHDITVGPALSFIPNTTLASAGDTLTFHFFPGKHNVAQSLFSTPCVASPTGFYSGFIVPDSGEDNTKFVVTVNDTQPIWFYCSELMQYVFLILLFSTTFPRLVQPCRTLSLCSLTKP